MLPRNRALWLPPKKVLDPEIGICWDAPMTHENPLLREIIDYEQRSGGRWANRVRMPEKNYQVEEDVLDHIVTSEEH